MDFWTVKNITGRLLAGLRWWNYVDDTGESHWIFEAKKGVQKNAISALESNIFWLSLIFTVLLWIIFTITTLFSPTYILITGVALVLNIANLYGFIRCKFGSNEKLSDVAGSYIRGQMFKTVLSNVSGGSGQQQSTTTSSSGQQQSPQNETMLRP
ncbi:unnamed protein product, partial [Didymodactylos carnosus]